MKIIGEKKKIVIIKKNIAIRIAGKVARYIDESCRPYSRPFIIRWRRRRQKNVPSTKFVAYICDSVLPTLAEFAEVGDEGATSDLRLDTLRLLAEMSPYCGELERAAEHTAVIFNCLLVRRWGGWGGWGGLGVWGGADGRRHHVI